MSKCCDNPDCEAADLTLSVNGKDVSLNPFVKGMLGGGILGMISSLKDADNPKEVTISIKCK